MKRKLLSVGFLLLSVLAYSQTEATTKEGKKVTLNADGTWMYAECASLLRIETYNGKTMISAKQDIKVSANAGKSGIEISLIKGPGSVILNFASFGDGTKCIVKNAPMVVEFADGAKFTINHMDDLNCKGNFALFLGEKLGTGKELNTFKTKKIKSVSIEYTSSKDGAISKYSESSVFTDAQADTFMKTVQCLSN